MTLSSEEIQILDYLKSWNGKFITMVEICRSAAGRQKFTESPDWAKGLMSRLVEAKLVEINERGHYSCPAEEKPVQPRQAAPLPRPSKTAVIVGDNYFPAAESAVPDPPRWVSPQIAAILNQSAKKHGGPVKS